MIDIEKFEFRWEIGESLKDYYCYVGKVLIGSVKDDTSIGRGA